MYLPERFVERMKTVLGSEFDAFIAQYDLPPVRGLRVNTLRLTKERFLELSPWKVRQSETLDEGLVLLDEAEHIGIHPYHIAGLFYMQEPSAMSVIAEAGIEPGMKVLDLCAAPGGKSGGIAARLRGRGLLVSNEVVWNRAKELARNLERLGAVNAVVTSSYPERIAEALPEYFDRVIVDAPCSGEGMFRKDPTAIAEWSPEHVASCAARQSAIMESASKLVAPGGKLVYSTCTFSPDENEGVIERFLSDHPEYSPEIIKRLYPHRTEGEGHFVARLFKESEGPADRAGGKRPQSANDGQSNRRAFLPLPDPEMKAPALRFFESVLKADGPAWTELRQFGDRLFYCPFEPPRGLGALSLCMPGVEVGALTSGFKKSFLTPSHSFFMAAHGFEYAGGVDLSPDSAELRAFLGGNTVGIDPNLKGFVPVTVNGFPVGFGKAVDGVLKNHLPKGLTVSAYR